MCYGFFICSNPFLFIFFFFCCENYQLSWAYLWKGKQLVHSIICGPHRLWCEKVVCRHLFNCQWFLLFYLIFILLKCYLMPDKSERLVWAEGWAESVCHLFQPDYWISFNLIQNCIKSQPYCCCWIVKQLCFYKLMMSKKFSIENSVIKGYDYT